MFCVSYLQSDNSRQSVWVKDGKLVAGDLLGCDFYNACTVYVYLTFSL